MADLTFVTTDYADRDLQRRVALFVQQRQLTGGALLTVEARRGVVTLKGTAATFHQRQLLYSFARRVAGVIDVVDELDVALPSVTPPPVTTRKSGERRLAALVEC